MLSRTRFEIRPGDGGLPIRGDLRCLDGHRADAAVVICHGFKGFREWGFFPPLARAVAGRGYAAVSFDFSHNGVGDDGRDFSALDRFAEQTHTRNVEEIRRVLDALAAGALLPVPARRLALVGHSRGGGEAVLATAEDPRVDALVTWAAIADIASRWTPEHVAAWERGETVEVQNARTGQAMPVGAGYWRDVGANREQLDIEAAARRVTVPWLIIHGEADETVPLDEGRRLFEAAGDTAELLVVESAGHTFGATHPYGGATEALQAAVDATLDWLDTHLA